MLSLLDPGLQKVNGPASSSTVGDRLYWRSRAWCIHRHRQRAAVMDWMDAIERSSHQSHVLCWNWRSWLSVAGLLPRLWISSNRRLHILQKLMSSSNGFLLHQQRYCFSDFLICNWVDWIEFIAFAYEDCELQQEGIEQLFDKDFTCFASFSKVDTYFLGGWLTLKSSSKSQNCFVISSLWTDCEPTCA